MPFVPVTPATSSSFVGSPKKVSAATAIAARASATTSCGTGRPTSRSTTSAAAPRSTASPAKSCPSACAPGTAKKSAPGVTARVSYASSRTSTASWPSTASGASAAIRRSSCIGAEGYGFDAASGEISRYWSPNVAMSANAGAATTPPQIAPFGSSIETRTTSCGFFAGTTPTKDAT